MTHAFTNAIGRGGGGNEWSLGNFFPLFFSGLKDTQFFIICFILKRKVMKIKNWGNVREILQIYCEKMYFSQCCLLAKI